MSNDTIISIICLGLALVFLVGTFYLLVCNPAPMTGHIDCKNHHPAYFPADDDTPWVYTLGITSTDGRRSTVWVVDENTYYRYSIGDQVTRGRK